MKKSSFRIYISRAKTFCHQNLQRNPICLISKSIIGRNVIDLNLKTSNAAAVICVEEFLVQNKNMYTFSPLFCSSY